MLPLTTLLAAQIDTTFDPGYTMLLTAGFGSNDPISITYQILNWILGFLGLISLIMIIYGGSMFLFSGGEEEKITKGKKILGWSFIGLLVILASYGVASYIFTELVIMTQ
jgi:hypothetical protein